jgi:hypothetical protein
MSEYPPKPPHPWTPEQIERYPRDVFVWVAVCNRISADRMEAVLAEMKRLNETGTFEEVAKATQWGGRCDAMHQVPGGWVGCTYAYQHSGPHSFEEERRKDMRCPSKDATGMQCVLARWHGERHSFEDWVEPAYEIRPGPGPRSGHWGHTPRSR